MSMNLGGSTGVKSDINVTPLVDVMLVLLIIIMIVAPLVQKGVDVKMPVASNTTDHPETSEQTVLAVTKDGRLWLNGGPVGESEIRERLEIAFEGKKEKIVLVKADEAAEYGKVMFVMDELRAAKIEDIGLITEKKTTPGQIGGE